MFINYKREIYALTHLNLSTSSFKGLSLRMCFINKHFNFFAVLELWLIQLYFGLYNCVQCFYITFIVLIKFVCRRDMTN